MCTFRDSDVFFQLVSPIHHYLSDLSIITCTDVVREGPASCVTVAIAKSWMDRKDLLFGFVSLGLLVEGFMGSRWSRGTVACKAYLYVP